jgi:hypothetical protein
MNKRGINFQNPVLSPQINKKPRAAKNAGGVKGA